MHPHEINFTTDGSELNDSISSSLIDLYTVEAQVLGKKYEEALTEQLIRQGVVQKKTKLQA